MSQFSAVASLGVSRSWRTKTSNLVQFYALSVVVCLFITLAMRAGVRKFGLWVISYFIRVFFKKYVIHLFFWRLPGVKNNKVFGLVWVPHLILALKKPARFSAPAEINLDLSKKWQYTFQKSNKMVRGDRHRIILKFLGFWWTSSQKKVVVKSYTPPFFVKYGPGRRGFC